MSIKALLKAFGPLRLALITLVIVDMLLRPVPGSPVNFEGIAMVSNLLAPVMSPILFMLLLLDTMMSAVYRSDKSGETRKYYTVIVLVDLFLAITFILYWIPYFKALNF